QHPDLAPNLNLALSTSFVPGEGFDIQPGVYFNHGSHVAGIAAAADNGVGVVGVAPEAEIVAVKVLSEFTGSGSFAGVGSGIVYAALIDADIINMSLGAVIPNATGPGIAALKNFLKRAVQFAHSRGATIIVAAGNEAIDRDHDRSTLVLPADLPHVIQVSATAPDLWAGNPDADFDVLASYSNFGQSTIDFSAPGGDFDQLASPPCVIGPFIVNPCGVADFVVSASSQSWFFAAGTSMAAPHVSGVAALIIARNGGDMNPAHVEAALRQSSDDIGKPGRDDVHGHGRVNAARAVGIL
ncbi:MAG: S8 family serine peptidase, partial [Thermoleophilaceae bacterium]